MRRTSLTFTTVAVGLALTACSGNAGTESPDSITLLTHDSFAAAVNETTFAAFTEETGITVDVVAGGDAGAMVNQAVLTKDNPIADVMFGIDDTFLSRALDAEVFTGHTAAALDDVDPSLLGPADLVTPIDYGDVCFNYDKAWFSEAGMPVPQDLDTLAAADNAALVTVEHPATSSTGLAFMMATVDVLGEDGWLDWWAEMRAGGVGVTADWDTAYYADFTRYGGDRPIVLSYASSPPAEVIFADEPLSEAPTGVIDAGCYRQVEFAGVLDGTPYPGEAGQLVDFMLSVEFQETIPLTWFVFPANTKATLPQEFVDFTSLPEAPSRLDAAVIAENRDRWIDEWAQVMEG